jgi:hypothetical protein
MTDLEKIVGFAEKEMIFLKVRQRILTVSIV